MENDQQKSLAYTALFLANSNKHINEVRETLQHEFPNINKDAIEGIIQETFYILHRFR